MHTSQNRDPSLLLLCAAFAAVYIVWGSTYYAIGVAIQTLPGLSMAGVRFFIAGILLYAYCRWRGAPRPEPIHWRNTFIVGALLLFGANGCVVWAEHRVPSGLTALLVAVLPMWMVLIEWLRPNGNRPTGATLIGILLGFVGVWILIDPRSAVGGKPVDTLGAAVLLLAGFLWALGSIISRQMRLPSAPLLTPSMQMLSAGVLLLLTGAITGDWQSFDAGKVTVNSVAALLYLIVFGSWIGFSAYVWLLRVSTPARVATYAYVNPVVAIVIGWALGGEELSGRSVYAGGIIIAAVAFITKARATPAPVVKVTTTEDAPVSVLSDPVAPSTGLSSPILSDSATRLLSTTTVATSEE